MESNNILQNHTKSSKLNKQNQNIISNEINIHQKRVQLENSSDPKQFLMTSIILYTAQYYPKNKKFIIQILNKLLSNNDKKKDNLNLIFKTTKILSDDVLRQIIYGPSTTFIPPSDIPHLNRLDNSLFIQVKEDQLPFQEIKNVHKQLQLEQIIPENRIKQILWYTRKTTLVNSTIVNNRFLSKQLRAQLQLGGQNWIDSTPLSSLFLVLKQIWKQIIKNIEQQKQTIIICQKFRLLFARFSFLHNKILIHPVKQLSDNVFHHYQLYIKTITQQNCNQKKLTANQYVQIIIQYSYCLLFYYKYKKCQRLMNKCCEILEFQLQYTGKLGRRTKYQSFDCAQLIMNLKKRNIQIQQVKKTQFDIKQQQQADLLIIPDANKLVIQQVLKQKNQKNQKNQQIKQSVYDQQSILLEKPTFTQTQQDKEKQKQQIKLTKQKILTAVAMINYTYYTVPHDQMLFQYISASLMKILQNKQILNYSFQFSVLLLRSLNDFTRIKNSQRALQQLQTLKNQYEHKSNKNVQNLFSTPYLTRFEFIMKIANKYMDLQLVLTGVQLLKRVGMYEECIDGLIQRQYKEKALQLVNQILEQKGKTPRLLCMLGDIKNNEAKYYEQAWDLSQKKYGRAQRSLGWVYFNKQDFVKAAECFTLATSVNYYNPNTWFTLGCCYIRLNQFDKALKPFGQSIRIDDTQGQAWGNIASCYMHLKRPKQAYSTLQQAVKHSQGNWKLWSNLLSVSLSLKQFYKFFECFQRIIRLDHQQIITKQTYNKIQMIMKFKLFESFQGGRKRIAYNFKRRIDRLFTFIENKIGQNPLVWQGKTKYLIVLLDYFSQMYKHYNQLHKQNKIDPNDLIDGYQTQQSTHFLTLEEVATCKAQIVQCKQTQLNMTMKIGWQQNKLQSAKVKQVLKQYIQIYSKYNKKDDKNQFLLFINGVKNKLQKCLQQKINLQINLKENNQMMKKKQ